MEFERLWGTAKGRWILEEWSARQGSSRTFREIPANEAAAWLIRNAHDVPEDLAGEERDLEL